MKDQKTGCEYCWEPKTKQYLCDKCFNKMNYAIVYYRYSCDYRDYHETMEELLEWFEIREESDECYVHQIIDTKNNEILAERQGPFDDEFEKKVKVLNK